MTMAKARVVRKNEGEPAAGATWIFKAAAKETQGRFDFMVGPVEYLSGPPLHVHKDQDDTFYVLEGVLTVQAGDEVFELEPGDFVTIPPGVPHTFDNLRPDPPTVRAINIMTPGNFKEFFGELAEADDMPTRREISRRYGVESVGPPLRTKLGLA